MFVCKVRKVRAFCERCPTTAERTECAADDDDDKANGCINIIYVKLL